MEVLCLSSVLQQQQKEEAWSISEIKTSENETFSAIFHTSGGKLEADRGEQDACVLFAEG